MTKPTFSDPRIGPIVEEPDHCQTTLLDIRAFDEPVTVECTAEPNIVTLFGIRSFNEPGEVRILQIGDGLGQRHPFDASECSLVGEVDRCVRTDLGIVVTRLQPLIVVFRAMSPNTRLKLAIFWEQVPQPVADAIRAQDMTR